MPSLPRTVAAVILVSCTLAAVRAVDAQTVQTDAPSPVPVTPADGEDGASLMRRAVDALNNAGSISAKARQKVNLFGQVCLGSGEYLQQGLSDNRRFRLALRMQVGSKSSSLLHVSDGTYLWRSSELDKQSQLEQINLVKVREHERQAAQVPDPAPMSALSGGLPGLLASLSHHFVFDTVQRGELQKMPVHVLSGTWNSESLAKLVTDKKAVDSSGRVNLRKLPAHLPHSVVVLLGTEDLFPYVIEYSRRDLSTVADETRAARATPIVTLEWFEVRLNAAINPQEFVYQPSTRSARDATNDYLRSLGYSVD